MSVIAIDPGPSRSGWVLLDADGNVRHACVMNNEEAVARLAAVQTGSHLRLAVEWISSFGMPVGSEVFDTVRWVGRFQQAWHKPEAVMLIPRAEVKLTLCHSSRAKDPNVRQALIDLYQPTGGGACPQVGTAKKPGPLYKVHTHAWAALAVAVVASARIARAENLTVPAIMGLTPLERIT